MKILRWSAPCLSFLAIVMVFCLASSSTAEEPKVWGGQHVSMELTPTGADLDFDCASGTIEEPLPLEGGRFRLKGTFTREHGGPVREEEKPAIRSATYSGTIENGTMQLRIDVAGEEPVQEYVLKEGQRGRVFKCR